MQVHTLNVLAIAIAQGFYGTEKFSRREQIVTDRLTDWAILTLVLGFMWLLNYRGHANIETSQRPVTNLPRWLRLLSGHLGKTVFDLHSLVGQITMFLWWLGQTIAVFIPDYEVYRRGIQISIMLLSLIIGAILVVIFNMFYRARDS